MSNIATMTISFCDFTGTIKCEYKEVVFPNLPYYSQCKPNYSYWLIPYSVCKLISTFPSNTFFDGVAYQYCYPGCGSCETIGDAFDNKCKETSTCRDGYHKIEGVFNNCIDDNNIDTSIDNTSIIYKSTGNYIYFDEENKYYSFIGDYCNGKYPYFLEGTKLCLRNCSEFIMFNIMEIVLTLIKTKPKEFKLHLLY